MIYTVLYGIYGIVGEKKSRKQSDDDNSISHTMIEAARAVRDVVRCAPQGNLYDLCPGNMMTLVLKR